MFSFVCEHLKISRNLKKNLIKEANWVGGAITYDSPCSDQIIGYIQGASYAFERLFRWIWHRSDWSQVHEIFHKRLFWSYIAFIKILISQSKFSIYRLKKDKNFVSKYGQLIGTLGFLLIATSNGLKTFYDCHTNSSHKVFTPFSWSPDSEKVAKTNKIWIWNFDHNGIEPLKMVLSCYKSAN